jgi:zinc transport system permease protein
MMELFSQNIFLIMALLGSGLASISSGIMGTYVVMKRISFLSGSLSHAILAGMGICLYLQRKFHIEFLTPTLGAFLTAIVASFILGYGRYHFKEKEETLISILWSLGMSIGIIFLAMTPGTNVDILNYLFGNLLWTGPSDVLILSILLIIVYFFHKKNFYKLVALSFDEKEAVLAGVNCRQLFITLLIFVGCIIVFLIKTVGAVLVMSMLTIPTAQACHFAKNARSLARLSVIFGLLYAILGVMVAYILNWPPGATITLMASIGYSLSKLGAFGRLKRANFLPKSSK